MKATTPPWWLYVKHILMEYPTLCEELKELKNPRITVKYEENRHGKGRVSRPVENIVMAELREKKQRKYDAVTKAMEMTKQLYPQSAEDRLKIIDLVYFSKKTNINGAAMEIPCHLNTAARWQADFIRLVAEILQLP